MRPKRVLISFLAACAVLAAQKSEPGAIELGFEQRVRNENWNNIIDLNGATDDEREQIRYRTRFWAKIPLRWEIDLFVGLNQETNQRLGLSNDFDEVVFDNAYIDFKRLFVKGLSLRVGRQNLMRGEGFLLFDGGAYDGSRAMYFNGFNLGYEFRQSRLELIGIFDPVRDRFLPRFHNQNRMLQEWDEQAVGAYYTNRNRKNLSIESYWFLKKEYHGIAPPTSPQYHPDRHIHTAGGRLVRQITPRWSATGEFAFQWGACRPHSDLRSRGGYGYVKRTFDSPRKPYIQGGYIGLAPDWDPLFARWPKWSELYIYSQWKEAGVGYWTNMGAWQAETGLNPTRRSNLRFSYYKLNAFEPFAGSPAMFGQGLNRGHLFEARFDHTIGRNWRWHALVENIQSGNFYANRVSGYFMRFEVSYTWNKSLAAPSFLTRR